MMQSPSQLYQRQQIQKQLQRSRPQIQQQVQMVKQDEANEEKTTIKYKMASPWNFFLQIDENFIQGGLIYWFAYSMGKIKNVAWGYFNNETNQMTIVGSCRFTLSQLLPILNFHKRNHYLYVASGTENKIDKIVTDYLGIDTKKTINRIDMMGHAVRDIKSRLTDLGLDRVKGDAYLQYIIDLTTIFLKTIEQNKDLVVQMIEDSCPSPKICSQTFYQEDKCEVYHYGTDPYLDPKDERYSEEFLLV